jgi:hypothetical protein
MWPSLWGNYAPTPEQLAYQEKKKAFARQVEALDQQINDQRPEDEDEEKLRVYAAAMANSPVVAPAASDPNGTTNPIDSQTPAAAPAAPASMRASAHAPSISNFSIIPSLELDKALTECEGALQNFILKVDWPTLFPYHDEAKLAEEKNELDLLQRKVDVARYNLISKVGPYRPLDPTLLFPSKVPQIVAPALQVRPSPLLNERLALCPSSLLCACACAREERERALRVCDERPSRCPCLTGFRGGDRIARPRRQRPPTTSCLSPWPTGRRAKAWAASTCLTWNFASA